MRISGALVLAALCFASAPARSDDASGMAATSPSGAALACSKTAATFTLRAHWRWGVPEDAPIDDVVAGDSRAAVAKRTAVCTAGGHKITARTSRIEEQWGGWNERDDAMLIRLWVDRRPLNMILRVMSDERLEATIDVEQKSIRACATSLSENPGETRPCAAQQFALGAVDEIEFAPESAFPGPRRDLIVTQARDPRLCGALAAYFDGGQAPAGRTEPASAPTPAAWSAWGDSAYRFDADNDGEIDDVAIMYVEQYQLHGTLVAVFARDSVLVDQASAPWWGNLLLIAMGSYYAPNPPATLKAAVWGGKLGLSGNTGISFHILNGTTYAHVAQPMFKSYRPMNGEGRKALGNIERARPEAHHAQIVVRTLPGMKPEPVCAFTRRSQIFE